MVFDTKLLELTSDLINPIQMRHALIELLKIEKGVSLISFEAIEAQPLLMPKMITKKEQEEKVTIKPVTTEQPFGLYRHGIRLKLRGNYFQLRNYLTQLEGLSWTFFWQQFHYQLLEHPKSELEIEIYSLSTKREFIGV
jgi:MSHA biogenesis protein MshJ